MRRVISEVVHPPAALVAAAVAMTAATALTTPLRAVLTLPIALVAPGAAIVLAARGRSASQDLGTDIALAVVLSFATWVLVALLLFVCSIRLETRSVVASGDIVIVSAAALAHVRLRRVPPRFAPRSPASARPPLLLAAAIAAAVAVIVGLPHLLPTHAPAPYSSVSLAGDWARVSSPIRVGAGRRVVVPVEVDNRTRVSHSYVLRPSMKGATWRGQRIVLRPGASWIGAVSGRVPAGGCLRRLAIELAERGARDPVGTLSIWFQSARKLSRRCSP